MGFRRAMEVKSTGVAGSGTPKPGGVFVTGESLTFPGSAVLVSFLLNLADVPFKNTTTSFWWALGVSFVIGLIIYGFSLTAEMTGTDKAKGVVVALLNILVLTGSALGVGSVTAAAAVTV